MRAADVMLRVCRAGRFLNVLGPAVLPWSDRDMVRLALRQPLLVAGGLTECQLTTAADLLALHDQLGHDQSPCLESCRWLTTTCCQKGIAMVQVLLRGPKFNHKVTQ